MCSLFKCQYHVFILLYSALAPDHRELKGPSRQLHVNSNNKYDIDKTTIKKRLEEIGLLKDRISKVQFMYLDQHH